MKLLRKKNIFLYLTVSVINLFFASSATLANDLNLDAPCIKAKENTSPDLGLSVHPLFDDKFWAFIDDLNVKWLRTDLYWKDIQPNQAKLSWAGYDNFLDEAQKRNIKVLLIINHPPDWATKDPSKFHVLVNQFAKDAAKFSNARVSAWEAFNEPNLPGYGWSFSNLSIQENTKLYARSVRALNIGLRSAGDDKPVIAGALSPNGQDPEIFMRSVFSELEPSCYDAISIHPYGGKGRLNDIIGSVQKILKPLHAEKTPIWITEYGSNDSSEHAEILNDAIQSLDFKTPLFWFTLRDFSIFEQYGMINAFGYKRPIYDQFKKITGDLEEKSKNP